MTYFEAGLLCLSICAVLDAALSRRALNRFKLKQAEIVAEALGDVAVVDGIELPKPDDVRWKKDKRTEYASGEHSNFLSLGGVTVDLVGRIYVGAETHMKSTAATKKYCVAVWKAYRSRVARKAIETST